MPHASAPSALLAWIRDNEPERFARIGHVLACKDWLRFCLTGTIGTDRTEASTSFTDVATQAYWRRHPAALRPCRAALPPCRRGAPRRGRRRGQRGCGGRDRARRRHAGRCRPARRHRFGARHRRLWRGRDRHRRRHLFDQRGRLREPARPIRAGSAATASCPPMEQHGDLAGLDGQLRLVPRYSLRRIERRAAEAAGGSIHAALGAEIDAALERPSTALFHPYLFGSPHGAEASASFVGLRGWQDRGDLLRARGRGHRLQPSRFMSTRCARASRPLRVRLTGGVSRNPLFAQMFADVLAIPVTVTATEEAAAWGAALCAGAASGYGPRRSRIRATLPRSTANTGPSPGAAQSWRNATACIARSRKHWRRYGRRSRRSRHRSDTKKRLTALAEQPTHHHQLVRQFGDRGRDRQITADKKKRAHSRPHLLATVHPRAFGRPVWASEYRTSPTLATGLRHAGKSIPMQPTACEPR